MKKIRAFIKLSLVLLYTLFTYGIYFVGLSIPKLLRKRYEPWRNLFMRTWAEGVVIILNMKVESIGIPPTPPFFLISNHLSYLDIIPLYLNLRCTFVAKKEVRSWPVLGSMVNAVGVIFINRKRRTDVKRVNELLSRSMNRYQGLILFPEGTSSGGKEVLPFHASLLQYPAKEKVAVHTASISYRTAEGDEPAIDSVCFFGARHSFLKHVFKMVQNRRVYCKIRFGDEALTSSDRKELAIELHKKVQHIFEPTSY